MNDFGFDNNFSMETDDFMNNQVLNQNTNFLIQDGVARQLVQVGEASMHKNNSVGVEKAQDRTLMTDKGVIRNYETEHKALVDSIKNLGLEHFLNDAINEKGDMSEAEAVKTFANDLKDFFDKNCRYGTLEERYNFDKADEKDKITKGENGKYYKNGSEINSLLANIATWIHPVAENERFIVRNEADNNNKDTEKAEGDNSEEVKQNNDTSIEQTNNKEEIDKNEKNKERTCLVLETCENGEWKETEVIYSESWNEKLESNSNNEKNDSEITGILTKITEKSVNEFKEKFDAFNNVYKKTERLVEKLDKAIDRQEYLSTFSGARISKYRASVNTMKYCYRLNIPYNGKYLSKGDMLLASIRCATNINAGGLFTEKMIMKFVDRMTVEEKKEFQKDGLTKEERLKVNADNEKIETVDPDKIDVSVEKINDNAKDDTKDNIKDDVTNDTKNEVKGNSKDAEKDEKIKSLTEKLEDIKDSIDKKFEGAKDKEVSFDGKIAYIQNFKDDNPKIEIDKDTQDKIDKQRSKDMGIEKETRPKNVEKDVNEATKKYEKLCETYEVDKGENYKNDIIGTMKDKVDNDKVLKKLDGMLEKQDPVEKGESKSEIPEQGSVTKPEQSGDTLKLELPDCKSELGKDIASAVEEGDTRKLQEIIFDGKIDELMPEENELKDTFIGFARGDIELSNEEKVELIKNIDDKAVEVENKPSEEVYVKAEVDGGEKFVDKKLLDEIPDYENVIEEVADGSTNDNFYENFLTPDELKALEAQQNENANDFSEETVAIPVDEKTGAGTTSEEAPISYRDEITEKGQGKDFEEKAKDYFKNNYKEMSPDEIINFARAVSTELRSPAQAIEIMDKALIDRKDVSNPERVDVFSKIADDIENNVEKYLPDIEINENEISIETKGGKITVDLNNDDKIENAVNSIIEACCGAFVSNDEIKGKLVEAIKDIGLGDKGEIYDNLKKALTNLVAPVAIDCIRGNVERTENRIDACVKAKEFKDIDNENENKQDIEQNEDTENFENYEDDVGIGEW